MKIDYESKTGLQYIYICMINTDLKDIKIKFEKVFFFTLKIRTGDFRTDSCILK